MFDPIQQQAGMTFLRSIAKQASLGALPYPAEPLPPSEPDRRPLWRSLGAGLARFVRFARGARAGRAGRATPSSQPFGSTAESIQG